MKGKEGRKEGKGREGKGKWGKVGKGRKKGREEERKHGGAKPIPLTSKDHQSAVILVNLQQLCWLQLFLYQSWPENIKYSASHNGIYFSTKM